MLRELHIANFVLIESLHLLPDSGLNMITGETGAGKSVLLGALDLILGKRADNTQLLHQEEKCVIEAHFDVEALELKSWFEERDVDYLPLTILRREILPNGRSRAFVNDCPVLLPVLRELGQYLIDIHSQNSQMDLAEQEFLFDWYDHLAGTNILSRSYGACFREWKAKLKTLSELEQNIALDQRERDFEQFQLDELLEAGLQEDELAQLEERHVFLSKADEIREAAATAAFSLVGDEQGILDNLKSLFTHLLHIPPSAEAGSDLLMRFKECLAELDEIAAELRQISENVHADPEELGIVEHRLGVLNKLMRKHQTQDLKALIGLREHLDARLQTATDREFEYTQLLDQVQQLERECRELAGGLHQARARQAEAIEDEVQVPLRSLGLPHSSVQLKLTERQELNRFGSTDLQFLFSGNKGVAPELLTRVASGGEFSRLMLVVKALFARKKALPTLVFDEIDTGLSGEAASKMAEMLLKLSVDLQVICITHLPQIAAVGSRHFLVYKNSEGASAQTRLRVLEPEERISEIAKMASGDQPGPAALAHARELLKHYY